MRISDWSSDVCSSDLTSCAGARANRRPSCTILIRRLAEVTHSCSLRAHSHWRVIGVFGRNISMPLVLGVTGSIATGKSYLCQYMVERYGAIHADADKVVHRLYEIGRAHV